MFEQIKRGQLQITGIESSCVPIVMTLYFAHFGKKSFIFLVWCSVSLQTILDYIRCLSANKFYFILCRMFANFQSYQLLYALSFFVLQAGFLLHSLQSLFSGFADKSLNYIVCPFNFELIKRGQLSITISNLREQITSVLEMHLLFICLKKAVQS